jgi:hypothetical protein
MTATALMEELRSKQGEAERLQAEIREIAKRVISEMNQSLAPAGLSIKLGDESGAPEPPTSVAGVDQRGKRVKQPWQFTLRRQEALKKAQAARRGSGKRASKAQHRRQQNNDHAVRSRKVGRKAA